MQPLRPIVSRCFSILGICTWFITASCHLNSTYNNREDDKADGEKVITQFYNLLKNKDYKDADTLFAKKFFEVTDSAKLNELLSTASEKLGNIESYDIAHWETQVIKGTDARANYQFFCQVKRSGFPSEETIALIDEKDKIKIASYHISSDGFLKK